MSGLRVVFMGTPGFAVQTMLRIQESRHTIVGVVTAPDKPAGRGQKMHMSAVKQAALQHNLPLLQPNKLKDPRFLQALEAWHADIFVVVAFRMLPEAVWSMPPKGTFNLHASLLPQYRGAAPINWAVINGESESGVTTFFINENIDTGAIIQQKKVNIAPGDNAGILHDKLMYLGAGEVVSTLDNVEQGKVAPVAQNEHIKDVNALKTAPKIFKDTCQINWHTKASKVHNHIRGLSPYPAAWTTLSETTLKIFRAELTKDACTEAPGTLKTDNNTYVHIACSDSYISLLEVQLAGKKRMQIADFLRGNKFPGNAMFV